MTDSLSKDSLDYLNNQEKILKDAVELIKGIPDHNILALIEIERNIKALKEEAKNCKEDDLPGILQQLNLQHQLAERHSKNDNLPDPQSPYFGHMKIEQHGKIKDIFLGHVALTNRELNFKIVDWKKAPIARVFYQYAEGDEFDFDLDDRTIEGTILQKSIQTIRDGELLRIDRNGESFVKREGRWTSLHEEVSVLEGGEGKANQELAFGRGNTNFDSPEVISLLDKIQYDIVNKDVREPLLITGGAGSGKTTVALYRLAKLCEKRHLSPSDALVLVPNTGLIKLSETLLRSVGLDKVHVKTNEQLIKDMLFQNIKGLPRKINYEAPLSVVTIKKHQKFVELMDKYLEIQIEKTKTELTKIDPSQKLLKIFEDHRKLPLVQRLRQVYRSGKVGGIERVKISKLGKQMKNFKEDLLDFYSDHKLLSELTQMTEGKITSRMLEDFKMHTARQIASFDEDDDYQNRKAPLRGQFDIEDLPILIHLIKLKMGSLYADGRNSKLYKHIFLDEAQELSVVELQTISSALDDNGNFTVAGDAVQQIDPSMAFDSWESVLKNLGVPNFKAQELNVSYRSPREIVEFAHKVLGPLAPEKLPESKRKGGPVLQTQIQHRAHASMVLSDALVDLTRREPRASVAIICNREDSAKLFFNELADIGGVRLVLDQDFSFRPGIDITTVDQIRGLEFDYVILPDADRTNYPESARARKRLHLAATRAIHQLWVLHPAERTILF
ncbi:UvrD-helicase domain-containing protein [Bacteriovorax sp. DB6_IX]|uniref:UvrD-helicase domain-containing protein n=1 Tax=Bacteriovorax sp. DB6_IX TaxID=1353530 RepID=UPI000389FDB2|nr:UvrD-helicase domain-containing protein [Bacteriovorax sp. DB6_IX]EQC51925.1 UvrD/REP helicase N-terminal domain protein [Bacteriovorax sp. DB6_IX]